MRRLVDEAACRLKRRQRPDCPANRGSRQTVRARPTAAPAGGALSSPCAVAERRESGISPALWHAGDTVFEPACVVGAAGHRPSSVGGCQSPSSFDATSVHVLTCSTPPVFEEYAQAGILTQRRKWRRGNPRRELLDAPCRLDASPNLCDEVPFRSD